MKRVDDLICDIQIHELVEIEGELSLDSRKRIEELVIRAVGTDNSVKFKRKPAKRLLIWGLAAVLTMAMGLTVVAARENEWDIELVNFMGLSDANTLQLDSGMVEINQGQTSICMDYQDVETGETKEVTMMAVSSMGDKNEVYVRIETDYELPENFNEETDYILPEDFQLRVNLNKAGYGAQFTSFVEDNKLGFLLEISNCKEINKAEITVIMEDLYWYHDLNAEEEDEIEPEKLLCKGTWELKWKYHYKSNTITKRYLSKTFEADGCTYKLTKVEISPISIRLEAHRSEADRHKEHFDVWLQEIHFTDGRILKVDDVGGSGMHNGMYAHSYIGARELGETIQPKEVKSLIISGEEIKIR